MARPTRPSRDQGTSLISARNSCSASASRPSRARQSAMCACSVSTTEPFWSRFASCGLGERGERVRVAPRLLGDHARARSGSSRAAGPPPGCAARPPRPRPARSRSRRPGPASRTPCRARGARPLRRAAGRRSRLPVQGVDPRQREVRLGAGRIERDRAVERLDRLLLAVELGRGSRRASPTHRACRGSRGPPCAAAPPPPRAGRPGAGTGRS